jgi:hypothetical protein
MKKLLLLIVLFVFIAFSGCGKKEDKDAGKTSDKKTEESVNENKDAKDDKDKKDDKTISLNDLGISEGVPKNYPSDIPQPKNAKCLGSLSSSEGTIVNFESTDKVREIVDFFKDEMKKNGFDIMEGGEILVSDDAAMIGWKKKDREISVVIGFNKENSKSQIALTYK